MLDNTTLIALDSFLEEHRILLKGKKYITDLSLAELFQIDVKYLRRKVHANLLRFPEDFMIMLSKEEREKFQKVKYAFADSGVFMISGLIKTDRAAKISIAMVELLVDRMPAVALALLRAKSL
jgi:ORF6N domain